MEARGGEEGAAHTGERRGRLSQRGADAASRAELAPAQRGEQAERSSTQSRQLKPKQAQAARARARNRLPRYSDAPPCINRIVTPPRKGCVLKGPKGCPAPPAEQTAASTWVPAHAAKALRSSRGAQRSTGGERKRGTLPGLLPLPLASARSPQPQHTTDRGGHGAAQEQHAEAASAVLVDRFPPSHSTDRGAPRMRGAGCGCESKRRSGVSEAGQRMGRPTSAEECATRETPLHSACSTPKHSHRAPRESHTHDATEEEECETTLSL